MSEYYKPVTIGEQIWPEAHAAHRDVTLAGVSVHVDSMELQAQITASEQARPERLQDVDAALLYVVDGPFPFRANDGAQLRRITEDYPGDIYAAPGLKHYAFHGINKFGTLASMAYGIRALGTVQDGKVGIHSALIADQATGCSTLLVAGSRAGKSSIGRGVELLDDRFVLLSDDWNEIDVVTGKVQAVSSVFSVDEPGTDYGLLFESFGKPFYAKPDVPQSGIVDRIIELHPHEPMMGRHDFLTRCLGHVPFMRQELDPDSFGLGAAQARQVAGTIQDVRRAIIEAYGVVADQVEHKRIVNDPRSNSVDQVVSAVRDIMS